MLTEEDIAIKIVQIIIEMFIRIINDLKKKVVYVIMIQRCLESWKSSM
jgi:hypothetical protein